MVLYVAPTYGLSYGRGAYGTCQYTTCSISLTSSTTVAVDVVPSATTACTVASDTVSVTTSSTTGYTLQLEAVTNAQLTGSGSGGAIVSHSATHAAPAVLEANRWGYRIDSGNFGAGPTSAMSSAPIPSLTFAGLTTSPQIIATSEVPARPAMTTVWYGVCADTTLPTDTYIGIVRYTAVVN